MDTNSRVDAEATSASPEELLLSGRRKEASPLNEPVWRYVLVLGGSCAAAFAAARLPADSFPGAWLVALFASFAWLAAIRSLLLDTVLRRFWAVWLAIGFAPLPIFGGDSFGAGFALFSAIVFLLFRLYKPYRHLTSARRAKLFGLGIVCLLLLGPGIDFEGDSTGMMGFGRALGWYAVSSLLIFWVLTLLHLFFGMRLHFLRLKPKLAVSGLLIAVVPLILVVGLGLVAFYAGLGGNTSNRGHAILLDWQSLVAERAELGDAFFPQNFVLEGAGAQRRLEGEEPPWVERFEEILDRVPDDEGNLAGWAPQDTTAYFAIGNQVWLVQLQELGSPARSIRAYRVGHEALARLSGILNAEMSLVGEDVSVGSHPSTTQREEAFPGASAEVDSTEAQTGGARITVGGNVVWSSDMESPEKPDEAESDLPLWERSLYCGGAVVEVLALQNDAFEPERVLLATEIRLAQVVQDFVSGENELNQAILIALAILAFVFLILEAFALFFGLRITTGITSAVKALHRGTQQLAKGNLETRIDLPNEDEFGDLAQSFNEMTLAVKKGQEEAVARERLERELRMARDIQQRLLPYAMPKLTGFEIAGVSEPSRQVGGDYYDFLTLGDSLGIAVGDVSGKGIPAALLMSNLQASLKGQATHPEGVGQVVEKVNNLLVHSTDVNMFATFFYGVLHRELGTFTATNAGHDPPILCHADGTIERLSAGGLMLGVLEGQQYEEQTVTLRTGDVVVLYTDGITEAMGPTADLEGTRAGNANAEGDAEADEDEEPDANMFEEARLLDVVRYNVGRSAEEIKNAILDAVKRHTSGIPQSDDITLVVIKCVAAPA